MGCLIPLLMVVGGIALMNTGSSDNQCIGFLLVLCGIGMALGGGGSGSSSSSSSGTGNPRP